MASTSDDQLFHHYTTKSHVISWISHHLFDGLTYTVRHGLLQGMKRKGGLGWLPERIGGPANSPEHAFWASQNLKGLVVYDIGAFHGLLTLLFARQARVVISYEPNSANYTRLMENLRLNRLDNVTVRKLGVGASSATVTMVANALMKGGASVESSAVDRLKKSNRPLVSEQVSIVRLDDDILAASLPAPDFIKIDVEGGELDALRGAQNTILEHRPALFLEIHGQTMNLKKKNAKEIVGCLNDLGYGAILHIESGSTITGANSDLAAQGHLYCVAQTAHGRAAGATA